MKIILTRPFYQSEKRFEIGDILDLSDASASALIFEGSAIAETASYTPEENVLAGTETPEKKPRGRKQP